MRSEAQMKAFADECVKIEKAGGDVLSYIAKYYPSYTPRATWYKLQMECLHRKKLTEGRPKDEPKPEPVIQPEWKEVKQEMPIKKIMSLQELFTELLKAADEGRDLKQTLRDLGYKNESSAIANVRAWAKKNKPERWEEMAAMTLKGPRPLAEKAAESVPDAQTEKLPSEQEKAPETPKNGGKIEKVEGDSLKMKAPEKFQGECRMLVADEVTAYRDKPSPTCCQPARPSGVTVPDELPEEKLDVCAVRSKLKKQARFEASDVFAPETGEKYMHYIWRDLMTREERSLGFSASEWKTFAKEILSALAALNIN